MRRSEVSAATLSDLDGNYLHITKAKVQNTENKWVIKNLTKTEEGKRIIYLPDSLLNEIKENGYIYEGSPAVLNNHLKIIQKKLGLPNFRYHDLRAFYASYAHSCGIPDTIIMANGGWRSDFTMKNHYRRAMQKDVDYYQKALAEDLLKPKDSAGTI